VAKTAQGLKGKVLKKKFVLPIESCVFTFFPILLFAHGSTWCHLQYDCYNFNMKFIIFYKKIYKFQNVGILIQDPSHKKNSSSLILTNIELSHVCST
jgi:hypothetical protein